MATIGSLVIHLEAPAKGFQRDFAAAVRSAEEYGRAAAGVGSSAGTAAAAAGELGGAAARGAVTPVSAAAAAAAPVTSLGVAIGRANGAAAGGTLGRWSGTLSTVASAATVASSAVNVFGGAVRGVRAVPAAGGLAREVVTLGPLRRIVGGMAGAFAPLGLAVGGAAGGLAGLAGIGAAAAWGVKLQAQAETARVAFTTLTGSANDAKALLEQLETFSAGTPFQLPGIQESARQLLAYGRSAGSIAGDLSVLGDIAASTGSPLGEMAEIYGRVGASGRVTGETLNRLMDRGVPITAAFARTLGVAESEVAGLISSGNVGFADLQRALQSTTAAGGEFAGGMAAQSRTLAGLWSTITDNFRTGFREAFTAVTASFNLPGLLREVSDYLAAGVTVLKSYTAGFAEAGGQGMEWGSIVTRAVGRVGEALAFAADTAIFFGIGVLDAAAASVGGLAKVVRGFDAVAFAAVSAANMLPGVEVAYAGTLGAIAAGLDEAAGGTRRTAAALRAMKPPGEGVRNFFADVQAEVEKARQAAAAPIEGKTLDIGADASPAKAALDDLKRFAESTFASTRTPFEEYQTQLGKLKETFAAGLIGDETLRRALKAARDDFEGSIDDGGGEKAASRSVGTLEGGSQAAFAAISNRIRGDADAKATAKNTAKTAALLAKADAALRQVVKNTEPRGAGAVLEVGGSV